MPENDHTYPKPGPHKDPNHGWNIDQKKYLEELTKDKELEKYEQRDDIEVY